MCQYKAGRKVAKENYYPSSPTHNFQFQKVTI